jgi:hypothetical protein
MPKRGPELTQAEIFNRELDRIFELVKQGKLKPTYELALVDTDGLTQLIRLDTFPLCSDPEKLLRFNLGLNEDLDGS